MVEKLKDMQINTYKKNDYKRKIKYVVLFVILLLSLQKVYGFERKTMDSLVFSVGTPDIFFG